LKTFTLSQAQDFLPDPCTLLAKKAKPSGTNHQTNLHKKPGDSLPDPSTLLAKKMQPQWIA